MWGILTEPTHRPASSRPEAKARDETPVFGVLCRGGQVRAQVVPDLAAQTLFPLIRRQARLGVLGHLPTHTVSGKTRAISVVEGARNHLPADRPLEFRLEIVI